MLLSLSVSDGYSYATKKSERDEALLSVVEPIILERQGCSFEHPGCVQKIKAMHLEVDPTLPFVVGNAHRQVYIQISGGSKRVGSLLKPSSARAEDGREDLVQRSRTLSSSSAELLTRFAATSAASA